MARQLNVRSDEAYETAHRLARQLKLTTTEVVLKALLLFKEDFPALPESMSPKQREVNESLRALSVETAKHKVPGATSDHSDMYDDNGLPI
jgi:hypothetical protein